MDTKQLIKLGLIKYKNNNYRIFANQNGRRIFLKELAEGSYIYPDLKIYLELDKIYNSKDITIRYLKNKTVAKIINGALIIANLSSMAVGLNLIKNEIEIKIHNYEMKKNTYSSINYDTARILAYQSGNLYEILNNNKYISNNVKKYINTFIEQIEPLNVDLTIFKRNLKDLKIVKKNKEEFEINHKENVVAYFDIKNKTIFYKETLSPETLYHELGHLLNCIYFEEERKLYVGNDDAELERSLQEGFATLFTSEIGNRTPYTASYPTEQMYVKILSEILGKKTVLNCFLGDLSLVDALSTYDNKEEINKTLMLINDVCETDDEKEIENLDSKDFITKKLMEWSIKSANKKYENLKNKNIYGCDLDQAYMYQLLNTDLILYNIFDLDLKELRKLELQFLDNSEVAQKYKTVLNDEEQYLKKLKEQIQILNNKHYFANDTTHQLTFEVIDNYYSQKHK